MIESTQTFVPHVGWLGHQPNDEVIRLLQEGHFEAKEQAFVWLYLRSGDCFLDAGAHFGLYSLLAACVTEHCADIISIEPDPDTANLLKSNLALHGITQAEVVHAALWYEAGRLRLAREVTGLSSHNYVGESVDGHASIDVTAIRLDELLSVRNIKRVDFAKIDTEGAELSVLSGASGAISKGYLPLLMIEFTEANLNRSGFTTEDLYRQLVSLGYIICDFDAEDCRLVPMQFAGRIWYQNLFAAADVEAVNQRLRSASSQNRLIAADILARAKACSRFKELQELDYYKNVAAQASANQEWAEKTESLLNAEKKNSQGLRAWAEKTENLLSAEKKNSQGLRVWAEKTENLLSAEKKNSQGLRVWAETAEVKLAREKEIVSAIREQTVLLKARVKHYEEMTFLLRLKELFRYCIGRHRNYGNK